MSLATPQFRVFFHVQNLSGVGHYVRTLEIAKVMSRQHQVWILDGGRPVPRPDIGQVRMLPLPRIQRLDGKLAPFESSHSIEQIMAQRREKLAEAIHQIKPHAVVVEHYPFSKWELTDEVAGMLQCARAAYPSVKTFCSLRDIPRQTRHEGCSLEHYTVEVLQRLHDQFDALMVHADPALARLEQFFPAAPRIRIPVEYTGIVAEEILPQANVQKTILEITGKAKLVVASAGGGKDAGGLLANVTEAWRRLRRAGELQEYRLVMFGGLDAEKKQAHPTDDTITQLPFSPDYLHWMQASRLSISCAGYNTVANILRCSCRAILVPNKKMSDQVARAGIMRGVGIESFSEMPGVEAMADAILQNLEKPAPRYSANLEGASQSAEFIAAQFGGKTHQAATATGTEATPPI